MKVIKGNWKKQQTLQKLVALNAAKHDSALYRAQEYRNDNIMHCNLQYKAWNGRNKKKSEMVQIVINM